MDVDNGDDDDDVSNQCGDKDNCIDNDGHGDNDGVFVDVY